MNERDKILISDFKRRLPSDISKHIKRLILFGSRVRGDAIEGSDLDVIILVDKKTSEIEKKLDDIVYQVMWDNDFKPVISLKVIEESRYSEALTKGYSFYKHVEEEGVSV